MFSGMFDYGPKFRFEILKRDKFTCQYCGRRPPDVVLNIEHILPKAEGGTDDPLNLTTACWDCNIGKGPRLVSEEAMAPVLLRNAEKAKERQSQLEAYNRLLEEQSRNADVVVSALERLWVDMKGPEPGTGNLYLHNSMNESLRMFLKKLPKREIYDAMKIAYKKMPVDWRKKAEAFTTNDSDIFAGFAGG